MDAELLFYGSAPELARPGPYTRRMRTTKESDMYAFGLLAWEVNYFFLNLSQTSLNRTGAQVFAGHAPFPGMLQIAAINRMVGGDRPHQPQHPELSNRIWNMIEKCWDIDPFRRLPIGTAFATIREEIFRNATM
jgi:hypothetical protein